MEILATERAIYQNPLTEVHRISKRSLLKNFNRIFLKAKFLNCRTCIGEVSPLNDVYVLYGMIVKIGVSS